MKQYLKFIINALLITAAFAVFVCVRSAASQTGYVRVSEENEEIPHISTTVTVAEVSGNQKQKADKLYDALTAYLNGTFSKEEALAEVNSVAESYRHYTGKLNNNDNILFQKSVILAEMIEKDHQDHPEVRTAMEMELLSIRSFSDGSYVFADNGGELAALDIDRLSDGQYHVYYRSPYLSMWYELGIKDQVIREAYGQGARSRFYTVKDGELQIVSPVHARYTVTLNKLLAYIKKTLHAEIGPGKIEVTLE